ncbi:gas vesicle protein GvpN [Tritonibacter multivorans]|uniref:Gas vesicle protein GvpN n=2 Tax=Tritonibacter multivorans TaxID=928856 RepID=A0A0P1GAG8_9RHOB|nr:gas vesicle protein GvpN [Tritonibacter multivorans]SFD16341.1 MoxR-like ATPase [Tritonibacter multivorans]
MSIGRPAHLLMNWNDLQTVLRRDGYVASDDLSVALQLALSLGRPLLLEGAAGVGKTEVARALSGALDTQLIRLQCYEGLDAAQAIYEWNYQRQLLTIRAAAEDGVTGKEIEDRLFSRDFLLERPLLAAITQDQAPVLLIDEIDRADEEFEAYLLEVLSEFQVSIPELGTITATSRPIVILTSNGTRDLSDALRRRCLYTYVEYPDHGTELAILKARCPEVEARLAEQIIGFVQTLRREDLEKTPGIAEMLDFAAALMGLGIADLTTSPAVLQSTLTTLLKTQSDQAQITPEVTARLAGKVA